MRNGKLYRVYKAVTSCDKTRVYDPMLREESFLLLNEQLETELADFCLWYSEEEGLFYEKGAADDKT